MVTDGSEWTLVCLPGGALTTVTWTRHVWFDEPETLRAFHALLCRQRFFGVEDERTLPALLRLSLDRQEEITERLKEQSQAVVDMLVATIGRLDADHHARHGRGLLPETVEPSDVYTAAVTVLMRLVFLLYAEEQGLLPLDDDAYASAYAASTLASSLRETATEAGEDALERSTLGWHRLLAASRAIHRGARHQDLSLPAYGGSLFDPDRFPWLEGRTSAGGSPGGRAAGPHRRPHHAPLAGCAAMAALRPRAPPHLLPPARRRADRVRLRGADRRGRYALGGLGARKSPATRGGSATGQNFPYTRWN